MLFIFLKACKKYSFAYSISSVNGLVLTLYPNDSIGFIEVKQAYYERNYFKLFLNGIKKMKAYRKESGR